MKNYTTMHHARLSLRSWLSRTGRWFLLLLLAPLLALYPLPATALVVGIGIIATLALIDPIWALCVAILTVPVQDIATLPGGLFYTQAALVLAACTWGLHILAYPERRISLGQLSPALFLLLWALALSATFTPYSQVEGLKETLRWSTVVLVYLLARNMLAPAQQPPHHPPPAWPGGAYRRVALIITCLLLATCAEAIVGLWQYVTGTGPESFQIGDGGFVRAYGTIGKPNSFAGYLNMGWPLALALTLGIIWRLWKRPAPQSRGWAASTHLALAGSGAATILLLAALGASFSRGGWVGALGGSIAMVVALGISLGHATRQHLWKWGTILAAGAGLLLLLNNTGILPDTLTQRINSVSRNMRLFDVRTVQTTPENFAIVERMSHLQAGWHMFVQHPLTGIGAGTYTLAYEGTHSFQGTPFAIHPWYTSHGHAHNYYLHIAAETGILGLGAYLLLLALLLVQAYRTMLTTHHWFLRSVAVGCCGIIGAVAVHSLFENLHALNMGVQLGSVWGVLEAMETHTNTNHRSHVG